MGYSSQDPHDQTRPSTEHGPQNHTWCHEEHTLQTTAAVEPLDTQRNAKLLTHGEKVKRTPDYPLHKRQENVRV